MKIALVPHDDDQALFLAYTCLREKPVVYIVTDSYIQPNRGERGCSAAERAKETEEACRVLGMSQHVRIGYRDDTVTEDELDYCFGLMRDRMSDLDVVYAPAVQGGNIHHDMVGRAARRVFGDKVVEYTTYTKTELWTRGDIEVVPTEEEIEIKNRALNCYKSQIRINWPHFKAVLGKSEWLNKNWRNASRLV